LAVTVAVVLLPYDVISCLRDALWALTWVAVL